MENLKENLSEESAKALGELVNFASSLGVKIVFVNTDSVSTDQVNFKKTPVLTTEDNVDKFVGDKCYWVVYSDKSNVESLWKYGTMEIEESTLITEGCHELYKYFHNKENLLEYIASNVKFVKYVGGDNDFTVGKIYNFPDPVSDSGRIIRTNILDGNVWQFKPATEEDYKAQEEERKFQYAISFSAREEAEFLISLTKDNSPNLYDDGDLIELRPDNNWDLTSVRQAERTNKKLIKFRDFISEFGMEDAWLKYISNVAVSKGFSDGVKYEWPNKALGIREVKFPFRLTKGSGLCDYKDNMILSVEGNWPTIVKEELLEVEDLVPGEIYTSYDTDGSDWKMTFRFKAVKSGAKDRVEHFSCKVKGAGELELSDWCSPVGKYRIVRPATIEEKKKLIKKEIKNDYFYGLE